MIDFKALKGDSTDNIPGVPGVGDKTAARLVGQFGDLDGLYAHLDEVKPEKLRDKLREHHDQVLASRELVTIHRDLPVALDLDAARLGDYDRDEVVRLFREYEFRTLIDRLPPLRGAAAARARRPRQPGGRCVRRPASRSRGRRRRRPLARTSRAKRFRCGTRRAPGLRQSRGAARRPSQRERRRPAARARFRLRGSDRRTGRGDPSRARAAARG